MRKEWPESGAEAFARVDWVPLMPKLLRSARGRLRALGWSETKDERPGVLEAHELVSAAVESVLSGERRWVPGTGATEEGLLAFLSATMRSIAVNRRTNADHAASRADDGELEKEADDGPSPERQLVAREALARIEQALADDGEALELYRAMEDGALSREDLTESLGWPASRVKSVRQRMVRRLEAKQVGPVARRPRALRDANDDTKECES